MPVYHIDPKDPEDVERTFEILRARFEEAARAELSRNVISGTAYGPSKKTNLYRVPIGFGDDQFTSLRELLHGDIFTFVFVYPKKEDMGARKYDHRKKEGERSLVQQTKEDMDAQTTPREGETYIGGRPVGWDGNEEGPDRNQNYATRC